MSKVLVLGFAKSGKGAVRLLNKLGISTDIYVDLKQSDSSGEAKAYKNELIRLNMYEKNNMIFSLSKQNINCYNFAVCSPGFTSNHKIIRMLKQNNVKVISEIELGYLHSKNIIAVTGTNGKSTTTKLIENMLKRAGEDAVSCGNFGYSFCEAVCENDCRTFVVESSSFQLEQIDKFKPSYIILTNITKDHLDRYSSFDEYKNAKKQILKNYNNEIIIANYDDQNIREILSNIKGNIYYYSTKEKTNGAYLNRDNICINVLSKEVKLLQTCDLYLDYPFEVENCLAVITLGIVKKVPITDIIETVKYFEGLKYRLEYVREFNGKKYYNNSKCTNIASCLASIKAIKDDCLLILGGSNKNECFEELFENLPNNVKHIAICGENANSIINNSGIYNNICKIYPSIDSIIEKSKYLTDIKAVLYSPSSASFDKYSCSEERGKVFCSLAEKIE